ncbi:MAG: sulfatase-like hydrolase/transferase, partial [Flavobacteriaceae bacterium]
MRTGLLLTMLSLFTLMGRAADQPNIIVILVDDAGYADWGFQGSTTILSPNIDAMVADGMNFTQGYVSNSVCAPSRAGLISGQYQNRFGFEYNIVKHSPPPGHTNGDVGLKTGIPTIANYLQDLGYKTGAFGKWHLGENINKYHPNNRGFDYFYGLLGGSRSYHQKETASDKKLMRNFDYAEPSGNFYITDILTDDFLNFMDTAENENKPFFAYLSYTAPHGPYHAKAADKVPFQGMGLSGNRLEYHGMVYNLDNNVGRIIDKLKDEGKYDNTLIIFLSDNGGTGPALNTPLRGKKSQQYEGGLRVPFTMTWPNKVPSGSTYDQQVISLDIAPTVIEAAGGDMTVGRDFVGKSLMPLAYDTNKTIHEALFWQKLDQWEVVSDGVNKVIINNNDWGEADNDTIAFNLNANLIEDDAGDIYSNTSTTLTNLLNEHANWKTELTLPDWIGDNVLKKICPNANNASSCAKLVNRYNAFTEPSVSGCTYMPGYYVSSTEGDDTNDGSSPDSPWQTLARLNSATLAPGDHVYFKAGDTFIGQLLVDHSGTAGNPIVFGRYGAGSKPILDGANEAGGAHLAAVLVENQEYIEFKGLHITNDRVTPRANVPDGQGYGIYVHNTGTQVMHHFRFTDMTFDGVYAVSTAGQDHDALKTAGIYIRSEKNTVTGEEKHVRDVVVQDCYFTNIAKFGFWSQHAGGSTGIGNDSINRNMDFVFRKNHFYKTGGSGITPGRTYNCLLEENLIEYPGSDMDPRMAKRGSGAWFFNCRNVVAQYNTVKHARGDGDTYGIHTDMSNQYVIVQYNYSEDTFGGFVEVLGNNDYITYRYNISVNDGLRQVKGNTLWVSDWHPQNIRS